MGDTKLITFCYNILPTDMFCMISCSESDFFVTVEYFRPFFTSFCLHHLLLVLCFLILFNCTNYKTLSFELFITKFGQVKHFISLYAVKEIFRKF